QDGGSQPRRRPAGPRGERRARPGGPRQTQGRGGAAGTRPGGAVRQAGQSQPRQGEGGRRPRRATARGGRGVGPTGGREPRRLPCSGIPPRTGTTATGPPEGGRKDGGHAGRSTAPEIREGCWRQTDPSGPSGPSTGAPGQIERRSEVARTR